MESGPSVILNLYSTLDQSGGAYVAVCGKSLSALSAQLSGCARDGQEEEEAQHRSRPWRPHLLSRVSGKSAQQMCQTWRGGRGSAPLGPMEATSTRQGERGIWPEGGERARERQRGIERERERERGEERGGGGEREK